MKKDNLLAFSIFAVSSVFFMIWDFNYVASHQVMLSILTSIFGIFMASNIGDNDVANSFGTNVKAKAVTIRQALITTAIFELSGAIFARGEVIKTVGSGIVDFPNSLDPILFVAIMLAALLNSGLWIFIATKRGLPVPATHSIMGGIVGASIMMGLLEFDGTQILAMVKWSEILRIAISRITSPLLGGLVAYIIYFYIDKEILKPAKNLNEDIKESKKAKKQFKEEFFNELRKKSDEEQIRELSITALDEDDDESFYKNKIKEFKKKERVIDIYGILKTHMPIIACLGTMVIASMFLFKGLNNVSTLDVLQNFWIVGILGTISHVVTFTVVSIVKKTELNKITDRIFSWFQIFTTSSFALSHGANDITNTIGPFAAILDVLKTNAINATSPVPFAVLAMFGMSLVIGLWFLGREVITTVGQKLASICPTAGFGAELGADIVILLATQLGIPVSSTHILIGAASGTGFYSKNTNWIMMKPISLAWVITLSAVGLMAAAVLMNFKIALGL